MPNTNVCLHVRTDIFGNKFTGTVPQVFGKLSALQIIHLTDNELTGTIPTNLGSLPALSWIDLSGNRLHGTIPSTFGKSPSLKDIRLGDNRIHDPIPPEMCHNTKLNRGAIKSYGCAGVLCPIGTYAKEAGHASATVPCQPCPDGTTTLYLGSTSCQTLSETDILSIFFSVVGDAESWPESKQDKTIADGTDPCQWIGVECDEDGEVTSLSFSLAGNGNHQY